ATLQLGILENAVDETEKAKSALEQSVWAAEASRHDDIAARAWIELMGLLTRRARYPEALALQPRVTATLARLGGNDQLEGLLHLARGRIFRDTARYEEAQAELERSLALFERRFGADDLRVADALTELGSVTARRSWQVAEPYYLRALAIKKK